MSGEFAYSNWSGYSYFVLECIAELHIEDEDGNAPTSELTPMVGAVIGNLATIAKAIAWMEAGDTDEVNAARRILDTLPAAKHHLEVLEAKANEVIQ